MAILAGLPALARNPSLELRLRRSIRFGLAIAAVGAAGGAGGHHLFVNVLHGSLESRAVQVGWRVGLATALGAWTVTYFGRKSIAPFEPGPTSDRALRAALPIAVVSGPLVGVCVSRFVIRRLRSRFGG